MAMDVKKLFAQVRQRGESALASFNKMDRKKKTIFIVGTAALLLTVAALSVWGTRPNYTPLYTDLSTQDAASITQYLEKNNIPYQLGDQGSTILVPAAQKYQLRLDLAGSGLPSGDIVGFESFDTNHFGETQAEEQVRYLSALQGELERTILKIDGVDDVRVHIVQPQQSLFEEDQKEATAAVLVKMKAGYSLTQSQVQGITNLVTCGVEGLKAQNVSVIDAQGNVLSDNSGSGDTSTLSDSQLKIKTAYETQQQQSIQSMLERVVGPGKAVVRVNASFDFDQVQTNSETYGNRQLRSSQTSNQTTTNGGASGQPGTSSNTTTYQQNTSQSGAVSESSDQTKDYDVDKVTEQRIAAPGQLQQLSLSVVVGSTLTPGKLVQIQNMVSAAAGIQPARGDKLSVVAMPFDNSAANQMQKEMAAGKLRHYLLIAGALLLVLLLVLLLIRGLRKPPVEEEIEYDQGKAVQDLLAAREEELPEESEEDREKARLMESLLKLAQDNPDETIEVLRSWLSED